MANKKTRKQKGYTLIEILVVISIIGFIAAAATYLANSAREKGRIAGLLEFSSGIKASLSNSPVSYWSFDGGNATDGWGQYHGTVNGATAISGGVIGGAMSFDGNDTITTSLGSEVDYFKAISSNAYTTSAWFKDNGSLDGVITGASGGIGNAVNYVVFINSSHELRVKFVTNDNLISGNVSDNKWHNIVVTWDGSNMYAYFDGKKQALTYGGGAQTNNFSIGATANGSSYFFNGFIDEVQVYSKGLPAAQVQKLYAEGAERHQVAVK